VYLVVWARWRFHARHTPARRGAVINETILYLDVVDAHGGLKPEFLASFTSGEREVLDRINRTVADGNSLQEVIGAYFDEVRTLLPCNRLDVAFLEEGDERLVLQYSIADYEPLHLQRGYASDIAGSPVEKIVHERCASIIHDMARYAEENPVSASARLLLQEGIRSSMTCPLSVENRPVGLILCRSSRVNAFDERSVLLHFAVAERLSQAVEKAYRLDQLDSVLQNYMEMLSFVSHEIKSPLASIITLGKTLASGYFGAIDERHRDIVTRIVQKAEYLHNLSVEYLNLARFESGQMELKAYPVQFFDEVISPAIEIIAPQLFESHVEFFRDLPHEMEPVTCNPELMKIVLVNFLSNGIKYGRPRGTLKLTVRYLNRRVRFSVWNEGAGFPPEDRVKLFKKFSTLNIPGRERIKGHGVGLYVCWKIVHLHGGHIWADSEYGAWAEFTVEIPQFGDMCIIGKAD